jgi:hypothetical protein
MIRDLIRRDVGTEDRTPRRERFDYVQSYQDDELSLPAQQEIEAAARAAVMAALDEAGGVRIVVVNVNIQIARGGGATNLIGSQNSAHNRWGDR